MFPPRPLRLFERHSLPFDKLLLAVAVLTALIGVQLWLGLLRYRASLMDRVTLPCAHVNDGEIPWPRTLAINVRYEFDEAARECVSKIDIDGIEVRSVDELAWRVIQKKGEMAKQGLAMYVLLRVDGGTPYAFVQEIMRMCEECRLPDFGFAVTPRS